MRRTNQITVSQQMTTNTRKVNVNTKDMLMCVLSAFRQYGIGYIEAEDFINAKEDKSGGQQRLTRLLFDLSILHMFDYDLDLPQLQIAATQEDMETIVLAHLIEAECPYLVQIEEGRSYGLNFESSREMILVVGWIMAVSDFFGHIQQGIIRKGIRKIQKVKQQQMISKPATSVPPSNSNLNLSSLCKCIRVTLSNINNLNRKKLRLTDKIRKALKEFNSNMSVEQFLNNDQQRDQKQHLKIKKLVQFITNEKEYMKDRKRFWAWFESVVKKDREMIQNEPEFQFQQEPVNLIETLTFNPQSLDGFMEQMEAVSGLMQEYTPIFEGIAESLSTKQTKITDKQKKELHGISKETSLQLNRSLGDLGPGVKSKPANSFTGIQLKQLLFQEQHQQQHVQIQKGSLQEVTKLCYSNIENLTALKFI